MFDLHLSVSSPQVRPLVDDVLSAKTDPKQRFGGLQVQAVDRVSYAHFTVHQFLVTELATGVSLRVTQYHFHSWLAPEGTHHHQYLGSAECGDEDQSFQPTLFSASSPFGVAFTPLAFLEFYYRVKTASRPEDGPVLVHCGTGGCCRWGWL